MGKLSAISWTDHTFSPWWGCAKIDPGCKHCYADTFADRVGQHVWGETAPRRFFGDKHWAELVAWANAARKAGVRRKVFIASMADVFELHADPETRALQDAARARLFALIDSGVLDSLELQLLTKRPENVAGMVPASWMVHGFPRNVWLGASVCDNAGRDARLPHLAELRHVVARVWVSYEPALEAVDFSTALADWGPGALADAVFNGGERRVTVPRLLDWIVVGAESGAKRRPFDVAWAQATADACAAAGVACWVKQDSAFKSGERGRIPDALWAVKQHPASAMPPAIQPGLALGGAA